MDPYQPASQPPRPPMLPSQPDGKTAAILAYIGLIGLIIAFVLNQSEKAPLASYHIRQSIGLQIVLFILYVATLVLAFIPGIRNLAGFLFPVIGLAGLIFLILGIVAAANGEMKPLPIVGAEIQTRLAGIG